MSFERECFKASRWSKGNRLFPAVLEVSPAGVTRYKQSLFGSDEIAISIAKIASVHIAAGPIFATILIESTGGTDPLRSTGHLKQDALRVKSLIEQAQAELAHPEHEREQEGGHIDLKACVWCAEPIRPAALICRFCGRDQVAPAFSKAHGSVLVVEDSPRRIKAMREAGIIPADAHCASTADQAIAAVRQQAWTGVFLDYDLDGEGNGGDVARAIAQAPWRPQEIHIHSTNTSGGLEMREILEAVGLEVRWEPITRLLPNLGLD